MWFDIHTFHLTKRLEDIKNVISYKKNGNKTGY